MPEQRTINDLLAMQAWPLDRKIRVTQTRLVEWADRYNGEIYISFSGGKDSTVLADLAARVYFAGTNGCFSTIDSHLKKGG